MLCSVSTSSALNAAPDDVSPYNALTIKNLIYFNAAALPQLGEVDRRARSLERARTKHFVVEPLLGPI